MLKQFAITAAATVALLAGSASATSTFNNGSISILAATDTQTDLGTTTVFTFDPQVFGPKNYFLTSGAGDFSGLGPFPILSALTGFDINNPSSFNFDASLAGFGSFAANQITNVKFDSTIQGNTTHNVLSFFVVGDYTVGSDFPGNAGATISADETFSLTQTESNGGQGGASISISATFVSPAQLPPASPEPATLSLFGAALAGLGAIRRRRK